VETGRLEVESLVRHAPVLGPYAQGFQQGVTAYLLKRLTKADQG